MEIFSSFRFDAAGQQASNIEGDMQSVSEAGSRLRG